MDGKTIDVSGMMLLRKMTYFLRLDTPDQQKDHHKDLGM